MLFDALIVVKIGFNLVEDEAFFLGAHDGIWRP
jgi:hypothetical protein